MMNKIKELVTKILAKVWKKPLRAINNGGIKYLADLKDTYYMYIREDNNGKSEYCLNLVMLATLDYLCQIVLDNPTIIWAARYDFLVNLHSNTRVYTIPEKDAPKEKRKYLEKRPGVFTSRFGPLNVVCSYNEAKRLDEDNQTIEVFIIDKWPAVLRHIKTILKECWWWGVRLVPVIVVATLILKTILRTV